MTAPHVSVNVHVHEDTAVAAQLRADVGDGDGVFGTVDIGTASRPPVVRVFVHTPDDAARIAGLFTDLAELLAATQKDQTA